MQNESEKVDRARLAATKWLPMSAVGAAIPFVIGSIMQLPVGQVLVAAALTSTLVFSGLLMQSYGRERQYKTTAWPFYPLFLMSDSDFLISRYLII
jgi:hypothetical protein